MTKPLTVICVGDVFGEPGRRAVQLLLPKLKKQHEADLAVVNVENSASGFGVTPLIARAFSREYETATDARPDRAEIEASELTASNGHRTLAASSVEPLP